MFYDQWSMDKFIRIAVLVMIMCITLVGNIYIIFKLLFQRHRTRLQLFILNLAFGDLTICCCTMTAELFLLVYDQEWILGNVACKVILYIQVVTLASTTFINVAMTHERYEAVCCPFRDSSPPFRIHGTILLCWLGSCTVALPQILIFRQTPLNETLRTYSCASTGYTSEWQRKIYFTTFATYVLLIPALCMTIWYIRIIRVISKSKQIWQRKIYNQAEILTTRLVTSPMRVRTVKLAMTIIIVFVICWTPYMLLTLIQIYSNGRFKIPPLLDGVLQTICFIQSGLNPLIYIAFNRRRSHTLAVLMVAASTLSHTSEKKHQNKTRGRDDSVLFG